MENTDSIYSSLRKVIEIFGKLKDEDWALLRPHLSIRKLKKNQLFAQEGKISHEFGFVIDGSLRHYYNKDGIEKTTFFYFEHDLVASYFSCISGQVSQITIEALCPCNLIVFPYKALQELYLANMAWQQFGRLLAEYLAMCCEDRMKDLLILSPEERYLKLLSGHQQNFIEKIPQHFIANFLGITPTSLSRIRKRVITR